MDRKKLAYDGLAILAALGAALVMAELGYSTVTQLVALALVGSLLWWWGHRPRKRYILPVVAVLGSSLAVLVYAERPRPVQPAYQLCYHYYAAEQGVETVSVGLRLFNEADEPAWFEVEESYFALDQVAAEPHVDNDPFPVTKETRNAFEWKHVDFDQPRPFGVQMDGEFSFKLKYGRSTDEMDHPMNVSGTFGLVPEQSRSPSAGWDVSPDSDPRRIESSCRWDPRGE